MNIPYALRMALNISFTHGAVDPKICHKSF